MVLRNIRIKHVAACAAMSFLMANSVTPATAAPTPGTGMELADDTLIVVTKPHADRSTLQSDLYSKAKAASVTELHANRDDWSIFFVTPQPGTREATFKSILALKGAHPEISGLTRNQLRKHWTTKTSSSGRGSGGGGYMGGTNSAGGGSETPPNDAASSYQWTLTSKGLNWFAAQQAYTSAQQGPAHITILASGVTPILTNNELGPDILQYDAVTNRATGTVIQEPLSDVDASGSLTPGEGSIDCQMSGSLTDNSTDLCGAASFGPYGVAITMLRIQANSMGASETSIDNALMWALNNQSARGGMGPISMSYGVNFSTASNASPLWRSPDIVSFGTSLANQGDILVVASGDSPGTWTGANAVIPTGVVVAQGSDQNGNLVNTLPESIYGSNAGLTTVANDPIAAPGTVQPVIAPNGSLLPADWYGTSFSTPLISSLISMVCSLYPASIRKTPTANFCEGIVSNFIIPVGTPAGASTPPVNYSVVIPNFYNTINKLKP